MNVLVIGGGGREHAVIKHIKKNEKVKKIFALPGNGGMKNDAECVSISATDIEGAVGFAKENNIDFCIVTPDDPLVLGMSDEMRKIGIPAFGPSKAAAIIEGSKAFSKEMMKQFSIPTARFETFSNLEDALSFLEDAPIPTVIKADGLALGKGVIIANTRKEAKNAVKSMMEDKIFGASGSTVVIEEFLEGPEVSVLSFTDGETIVPMVSSMDHKRALDGDKGLNTGGMGTIAPNPFYTEEIQKRCMEEIFIPTINAMNELGRTFKGCLYFGLMITKDGPKVIEYNCRFGDPETQVVLPLLDSDLLEIMLATENETLKDIDVKFKNEAACCVILASGGYPQSYKKGFEISFEEGIQSEVFVAGAELKDEKLLTNGGRVLGVTAVEPTLEEAVKQAYKDAEKIHFTSSYFRHDIGQKALLLKGE